MLRPGNDRFPEIDAVWQPASPAKRATPVDNIQLFQYTVSRDNKRIDRVKLARILEALPCSHKYTLNFMVSQREASTFKLAGVRRDQLDEHLQHLLDRVTVRMICSNQPFSAWGVQMLNQTERAAAVKADFSPL